MTRTLTHEEWKRRYRKLRDIADRVNAYRIAHARKLCKEAGLDPGLLGIHPHNAMCSYHDGRPWPGVDYSKVRACLRELEHQWDASRIVDNWSKRYRVV